jgi:predicted O-methyltransferase YrrM
MPLPQNEPDSPEAVAAWVRARTRQHDRFAAVFDQSEQHRQEHGADCTVYPTSSGPLLGALVEATHARRILEVGCGLGYSALWLADGALPDGHVDTIEKDDAHADIARDNAAEYGFDDMITVHAGRAVDVLPHLDGPYDLVFCDGDLDEYAACLAHFVRLLRHGGLLITSNLFLGVYTDDLPGIQQAIEYRERILDDPRLRTAFTLTGLALSVRTEA